MAQSILLGLFTNIQILSMDQDLGYTKNISSRFSFNTEYFETYFQIRDRFINITDLLMKYFHLCS